MTDGVEALLRIGRNTTDMDRAVAFYRDALGFGVEAGQGSEMAARNRRDVGQDPPYPSAVPPAWTRVAGAGGAPARWARLSLGMQEIELTEFPDATPYPHGSTSCDLWFQHCAIVVSNMDAAYQRVIAHGAIPITQGGPQLLPPSTGSVTAFKFRDPDGHPLELIHFPAGTGAPCWQSTHGDDPTRGIDHSAISVGEVARSARFYEQLGLHVATRGVNRGAEQQRLDDLADVEVDVIALPTATRTPHVELLGYRQPRGRAVTSMAVTAVAADRLEFSMRNLHAALDKLRAVDETVATCDANSPADNSQVALLRDPDGHWIVLAQCES